MLPLCGAGITTFNALRNAARAGDTVAIQGVGWTWPPWRAVFARKMGLRTVALVEALTKNTSRRNRSAVYIDAKAQDAR